MNAIELLKADHDKVRGLFEQLTNTTSRAEKTRMQLLEKIRLELDVHTQIEEEIFYPAFREAAENSEDKEMIFEALEEHRAAGELVLPDLMETEVASDQFGGRAKIAGTPMTTALDNFHMTCAVSRASETMGQCLTALQADSERDAAE